MTRATRNQPLPWSYAIHEDVWEDPDRVPPAHGKCSCLDFTPSLRAVSYPFTSLFWQEIVLLRKKKRKESLIDDWYAYLLSSLAVLVLCSGRGALSFYLPDYIFWLACTVLCLGVYCPPEKTGIQIVPPPTGLPVHQGRSGLSSSASWSGSGPLCAAGTFGCHFGGCLLGGTGLATVLRTSRTLHSNRQVSWLLSLVWCVSSTFIKEDPISWVASLLPAYSSFLEMHCPLVVSQGLSFVC